MRRKAGTLVPLELAICVCALELRRQEIVEFHGYEMARRLGDAGDQKLLTAYGTLYRALSRLEQMGMLESHWEDPAIPARENRPGRRLYTLTAAGEAAVRDAAIRETEQATGAPVAPGWPGKRPGRKVAPA
jgi:PadR family transcriptional regulator PadR